MTLFDPLIILPAPSAPPLPSPWLARRPSRAHFVLILFAYLSHDASVVVVIVLLLTRGASSFLFISLLFVIRCLCHLLGHPLLRSVFLPFSLSRGVSSYRLVHNLPS